MSLLSESWIKYINLDHRTDRREHMEKELARVGINAKRFPALKTSDHPWTPWKTDVMMKRTPGAVGCAYSQASVIASAYQMDMHSFVMEDDLVFCNDFWERFEHLEKFLSTHEWDVAWLGGTVHLNPPYWWTGTNPDLLGEYLGRDAETTDDPRIIKTYGAFSTYAYIVNKTSTLKVLTLLDSIINTSMGVDWSFIKLGKQLNCYMYLPGMVKQMNSISDIGNGITYFENFSALGPYWWQPFLTDFDPATFNFGEAQIK